MRLLSHGGTLLRRDLLGQHARGLRKGRSGWGGVGVIGGGEWVGGGPGSGVVAAVYNCETIPNRRVKNPATPVWTTIVTRPNLGSLATHLQYLTGRVSDARPPLPMNSSRDDNDERTLFFFPCRDVLLRPSAIEPP